MNNEISDRQDATNQPVDDMASRAPRTRFKKWVVAMLSLLQRGEKKIVENFRVPPNGA